MECAVDRFISSEHAFLQMLATSGNFFFALAPLRRPLYENSKESLRIAGRLVMEVNGLYDEIASKLRGDIADYKVC
ncbi:hypothetical protein AAHA92_06521 [Salvia divinorum]|uniref:Uncharacterized protein n=1 Tax=Salvia divinorum TaxID=28513 RepID=A0ABD1I9F7_SALDI